MSIRSRLRRLAIDDSRSFYNWDPCESSTASSECAVQQPDPEPPRTPVQLVHIPAFLAEYVNASIANKAWDDFKHDDPQFIAGEAYWALIEHHEHLGFDFSDTTAEFDQALRDGINLAIDIILKDDETRTKVISHADSGSDTGLAVIVLRHDGDYYILSYDNDGAELLTHGTTTIHAHLHPAHDAISRAIAEAF